MKKMLCKISSVCLTLALVLSLSVLPVVSGLTAAAAASHESDSDFVALTIENSFNKGKQAEKNMKNLTVTDLPGGGLHYLFSNGNNAITHREGYGEKVKLDGLTLYFDNLAADESSTLYAADHPGDNARMTVFIGDNAPDNNGPKCWGATGTSLGFELNPEVGDLALCRNTAGTVEKTALFTNEEALKYANITGKEFSYSFAATTDGGYNLTVSVKGFEPIKTAITKTQISGLGQFKNPDASYVMVSTIAINQKTAFMVDFLGLSERTFSSAQPYIDAINDLVAMSDEVLLYSGNVMRSVKAAYISLDDATKALVTNYGELAAVERRYQTLANAADSYMVKMNTAHARCTNAANLMNSIYGSAAKGVKGTVKVTDLETGGMRLFIPKGSSEGVREYYTSNVNLDGVKLQFDNFVDNGGGANYRAGQMAILFGNGELSDPTIANCFALVFNPNSGTLYAIPNEKGTGTFYNSDSDTNIDGYVVIRSEYLKGANLEHRRFSLALAENPEVITDDKGNPHHGYDVTVEISGQKLTGTVPYTGVLDKVSNISYTDNVTVGLSLAKPYGNGNTRGYSVDWLGVYSGVVDGRNNNYVLDSTNATVAGGAVIDQGQVSLPQGGSVEFTVNSESVYLKLMGYNSNSSVQVFINDNFAFDCAPTKLLDRWYNATADIVTSGTTKVKLVNNVASLVTLDGVNIVLKGDINDDGAVNGSDLTVMRKYLLGVTDTRILVERADLSGNDGQVNILDLVALKKLISGYTATINNFASMPAYYTTTSADVDLNNAPNWTKDIIIGEVNLRTATEEGTIQAATKVLDHYAEMGINCVWITPVYDGGNTGNGYGNLGIDTIDPKLTQKKNYEEGWAVLKDFIDKAHEKNIRVVLDVVFRGVMKESPLCSDHPAWFETDTEYSSRKFKWSYDTVNKAIADWYVAKVVEIAKKTGCDGFRYDMMPATVSKCSIDVEQMIVDELHKNNLYLFIMSESANSRRDLYATETVSIPEALSYSYYEAPYHLFLGKYSIAEFIRSGSTALNGCGYYKYYTYSLANHDFKTTAVNGSRIAVGYQAIFSPFIPLIYLGEEWNNPYTSASGNPLYNNPTDWSAMDIPENRAFYEDVKTMIRIRRTYPDLFNINADQFKDSNICKLTTSGAGVPAYARYAGNRAALIVPNNFEKTSNVDITVSLADLGLESYNSFTVTDAETGSLVRGGTALEVTNLTVTVDAKDQRVLIITGENK